MEYLIIVYYYVLVETNAVICIANQYTGLNTKAILNSNFNSYKQWYKRMKKQWKKKVSWLSHLAANAQDNKMGQSYLYTTWFWEFLSNPIVFLLKMIWRKNTFLFLTKFWLFYITSYSVYG